MEKVSVCSPEPQNKSYHTANIVCPNTRFHIFITELTYKSTETKRQLMLPINILRYPDNGNVLNLIQ